MAVLAAPPTCPLVSNLPQKRLGTSKAPPCQWPHLCSSSQVLVEVRNGQPHALLEVAPHVGLRGIPSAHPAVLHLGEPLAGAPLLDKGLRNVAPWAQDRGVIPRGHQQHWHADLVNHLLLVAENGLNLGAGVRPDAALERQSLRRGLAEGPYTPAEAHRADAGASLCFHPLQDLLRVGPDDSTVGKLSEKSRGLLQCSCHGRQRWQAAARDVGPQGHRQASEGTRPRRVYQLHRHAALADGPVLGAHLAAEVVHHDRKETRRGELVADPLEVAAVQAEDLLIQHHAARPGRPGDVDWDVVDHGILAFLLVATVAGRPRQGAGWAAIWCLRHHCCCYCLQRAGLGTPGGSP
mmetsp:Transcript_84592/g.213335  ORF Transcript_84592/g.213335 Transcript_84592/m.213335 type:complete len:350 (+) Transcript_84592:44-1093(+)